MALTPSTMLDLGTPLPSVRLPSVLADAGAPAFETSALAGRPVLVGTDCPSITAEALAAAFDAIDPAPGSASAPASASDLVLLPTEDGGYALVGASRIDRSLFDAMPWSTEAVYAQTCVRADRLGWQLHALPTGWDVDRPEDIERLRATAPELFHPLEVR